MSKPLPEIVHVRWEGENPAFIEAYHATNRPDEFTQYTRSDIVEKLRAENAALRAATDNMYIAFYNLATDSIYGVSEMRIDVHAYCDEMTDKYAHLIKDTE